MKLSNKSNKKSSETHHPPMENKNRRTLAMYAVLVLMFGCFATAASIASDPLTIINNLSEFIFSLIRVIGMILLGFGIVQVDLFLKSHGPSQRANDLFTLADGVIITFAREILTLITG